MITSNRRQFLQRSSGGFGAIALNGILSKLAQAEGSQGFVDPLAPRKPRFQAKAKRVIFLYMTGGVSHVESFDHKPRLFADDGKAITVDNWQGKFGDFKRYLRQPKWGFQPGGQSGIMVSDLFPHMRNVVDDLCVIRSMVTDHTNHYESTLGMHCGSWTFARPSIGSWISYGLGSENENLPAFMVVAPNEPYAGAQTWGSDFLPGCHQGTRIRPGKNPIENLQRRSLTDHLQQLELGLIADANRRHLVGRESDTALEARIKSLETAFGMQAVAPEVLDLSKESDATLDMYGITRDNPTGFGWQCLIGRRLAEQGVRFIELIDTGSSNNWDSHGNMKDHVKLAKNVDQPIAGLIKDLKQRGLFEDTLVVWTTEFGRTPYHENLDHPGREHHHQVFSSWLAGAGIKPGIVHGASDEHGIGVAEDPVHVHDFHATILHLLGLDHEKLTFRHAGRDYRLTDVHGNVAEKILA
jgi:hypothetical protein